MLRPEEMALLREIEERLAGSGRTIERLMREREILRGLRLRLNCGERAGVILAEIEKAGIRAARWGTVAFDKSAKKAS